MHMQCDKNHISYRLLIVLSAAQTYVCCGLVFFFHAKSSVSMDISKERRYKVGPVTEKDEVLVLKPSPRLETRHLVVGDATFPLGTPLTGFFPDIREVLPLVKDMPVYDDDVFLIAFAKTGTHWTWEIVNMLMKGTTEYQNMAKAGIQLEFHLPDEFTDMPCPRVFNTHLLLHHIPKQAIEKKCKIITVQRNPKDVVVSLYYHMMGFRAFDDDTTFSEFLDGYLMNDSKTALNWFYYTRKLEEMVYDQTNVQILNVHFEDLKCDPVKEVRRIVNYLGIDRSDEFITQVVDKCCFKNLKKADDGKAPAIEGLPKLPFIYRKGEVGDWKNHFTVAQSERFDEVYNERLKDCRFTFKYTL